MDKIFFPTDFSPRSANALRYAVELGNKFNSTIYIHHTYGLPGRAAMLVNIKNRLREDALGDILTAIKEVTPYTKETVTLEPVVSRGDVITEIVDGAEERGADLIVMGTQGASGLKEIFVGSTTSGVVKNSDKTVLIIPNEYKYNPIKRIVLAVDSSDVESERVLTPLKHIAHHFEAKILVYHLEEPHEDAGMDPSIGEFLADTEHSYHYELTDSNVNKAIEQFVEDYNADMLCMIRRKRSFLEEVFHSSVTMKSIFDPSVPLLILNEMN